MKDRSAAIITIRHASQMTKRGKKQVADWMRKQAEFLEQDGNQFAARFTARYMYRNGGR